VPSLCHGGNRKATALYCGEPRFEASLPPQSAAASHRQLDVCVDVEIRTHPVKTSLEGPADWTLVVMAALSMPLPCVRDVRQVWAGTHGLVDNGGRLQEVAERETDAVTPRSYVHRPQLPICI